MGSISSALDKYQQRIDTQGSQDPDTENELVVHQQAATPSITSHPALINAMATALAPVLQIGGYVVAILLLILGLCILGYIVEESVIYISYSIGIIIALSLISLGFFGGQRAMQGLLTVGTYSFVLLVFSTLCLGVISIALVLTTPVIQDPATRQELIASTASVGISAQMLLLLFLVVVAIFIFSQREPIAVHLMQTYNDRQAKKK